MRYRLTKVYLQLDLRRRRASSPTGRSKKFHVHGITADIAKYYYVIAALDQEEAGQLLDRLRNTRPRGKQMTN